MNETVMKPVTLAKEDFVESLLTLTNDSHLPLFIVEYILKDFLNEIHIASQQQLEADKTEYKKQLDKLNNTNNKDKNLP